MESRQIEHAIVAGGPGLDWVEAVCKSVASLRYGTVEIIVHDGAVTQIERTERMRFDKSASAKSPGTSSSGQSGGLGRS